MKCSNCGAEIRGGKFCEFCGAQISSEMLKEQEKLNKQGCPKCGSSNIAFRRENHGVIQGKSKKVVVHKTIGMCNDCGYTWTITETPKKRKTWLWVLGWIFIFPLPLTLILVKNKKMKPVLKYGLIATAWLLYLIFALSGSSSDNTADKRTDASGTVSITQQESLTENDAIVDYSSVTSSGQATSQAVSTETKTATSPSTTKPATTAPTTKTTTTTTTTTKPSTTTTTARPTTTITTNTTTATTKATTVYVAPTTTKREATTSSRQISSYYVLNTNPDRMRIHIPSCSSVQEIKPENYSTTDDYNWAIAHGYSPCGRCHPDLKQ